jgi:hypothetical protein
MLPKEPLPRGFAQALPSEPLPSEPLLRGFTRALPSEPLLRGFAPALPSGLSPRGFEQALPSEPSSRGFAPALPSEPSSRGFARALPSEPHIAPYICIQCDKCCGYIYNKFYNFYNKWITFKTIGFTLLFLTYISITISEIVYGQVVPTNMTCGESPNKTINYKLHSLDIYLWLLIDSMCLIAVLMICMLFSYIDNKWNLNYIENICIFLLMFSFIFIFVWTIIGLVIIVKIFAPCERLNTNNTSDVMIIRLVIGCVFYAGSFIMAIIECCINK